MLLEVIRQDIELLMEYRLRRRVKGYLAMRRKRTLLRHLDRLAVL